MFKRLIEKIRSTRKPNPFWVGLIENWDNPDIYGPWTTSEDWVDVDGNRKFFKSFYLISTNEPFVIETIDEYNKDD